MVFLVVFCCVSCDQATKRIASHNLPRQRTISLLNDILRLQYTENPGAFLSLGASAPENLRYVIFTVLVGIILLGLTLVLFKAKNANVPTTIALSLVLGGGIGNLIDRILNDGRVIDFLNIGCGSIRTGIFNVADIAVTFGLLSFVSLSLKHRKSLKKDI